MALTKELIVDRIEVLKNGILQVRFLNKVYEDGVLLSQGNYRKIFNPGDDVSAEDQSIQNMAASIWTAEIIAEYTAGQTGNALTLEQQKFIKIKLLYSNVKRFIEYQPSGFIRYDADLKLNLINAGINGVIAGTGKPEAVTSVETWIGAVQTEFFTLKTAINTAEDIGTLEAVDVSYNHFETKYGREGIILADPGISTDDLTSL